MKLAAFVAAAALSVAAVVPAIAQTTPPKDTGSMAYPAPVPQGNVSTTPTGQRAPTDTGSMAYPAPLPQGAVGASSAAPRGPADTGSMAYPAPKPSGVVGTTTVK